MPGSRGSNPTGADPADVAEWRSRALSKLAPPKRAGLDAKLPADPLSDPERTLRILSGEE